MRGWQWPSGRRSRLCRLARVRLLRFVAATGKIWDRGGVRAAGVRATLHPCGRSCGMRVRGGWWLEGPATTWLYNLVLTNTVHNPNLTTHRHNVKPMHCVL